MSSIPSSTHGTSGHFSETTYGNLKSEIKALQHLITLTQENPSHDLQDLSTYIEQAAKVGYKDAIPIRDTEEWKHAAEYIEKQEYENAQTAIGTVRWDQSKYQTFGSFDFWILIEKVLQHPFTEDGLKLLMNLLYSIFDDTSNWEKTGKQANSIILGHLLLHICTIWNRVRAKDGAYRERMIERRMDALFYGILSSQDDNQIDLSFLQKADQEVKDNYKLLSMESFPAYKKLFEGKDTLIDSWIIAE